MTPLERGLYALTRFEIEDDVIIADELFGCVTGIKVTTSGEDEYRVFYYDNGGNPREEWFRDSLLEPDEPDEPETNVVAFPCRCERDERKATRH